MFTRFFWLGFQVIVLLASVVGYSAWYNASAVAAPLLIGATDVALGLVAVLDSEEQIENFSGKSIPGGTLTPTLGLDYALISGAQALSGALSIVIGLLFFAYGNQHEEARERDATRQRTAQDDRNGHAPHGRSTR